jgi:hypothetical protein
LDARKTWKSSPDSLSSENLSLLRSLKVSSNNTPVNSLSLSIASLHVLGSQTDRISPRKHPNALDSRALALRGQITLYIPGMSSKSCCSILKLARKISQFRLGIGLERRSTAFPGRSRSYPTKEQPAPGIVWSVSLCANLNYFKSNDQTAISCRCVAGTHENIASSELYLLCFSERFVSAGETDV